MKPSGVYLLLNAGMLEYTSMSLSTLIFLEKN